MNREDHKYNRYISINGGSRWADAEEIKYSSTKIHVGDDKSAGCGLPIMSDGNSIFVDNSDAHTMILGSTGSKKTRLIVKPLVRIIAKAGESMIITDPKGELYDDTSGFVSSMGHSIKVIDLRDPYKSDQWNPLSYAYELYHSGKIDDAISMLNDFINFLAEPQRSSSKDIYFIENGCSYLFGYLLYFLSTTTQQEFNIFNFANFFMTHATPEATEEIVKYVAEGSIANLNLKSVLTVKDAKNTFGCIASSASAMLNTFILRKTLCQVLSNNSFDIRDIAKEKTAIYIIVPDEKTTLHFLVSFFINQTYEILIDEAQQQANRKLPMRVNYICEEFCTCPVVPDMQAKISAGRSRDIRFFLVVQGWNQLQQKYGKDANTIMGNCQNIVFLPSRELELLMIISNLCGEAIYNDYEGDIKSRPLISISELQRLNKEKGEALILHGKNYPFMSTLPDIDNYLFKKYPSIERKESQLPLISPYNAENIISEIINRQRPLPCSSEVLDNEAFYDNHNEVFYDNHEEKSSLNIDDLYDW
jgi:type IV secretion system protein VirD4